MTSPADAKIKALSARKALRTYLALPVGGGRGAACPRHMNEKRRSGEERREVDNGRRLSKQRRSSQDRRRPWTLATSERWKVQRFSVHGRGPFPWRLLSKERAWIVDESLAESLSAPANWIDTFTVLIARLPQGRGDLPLYIEWEAAGWPVVRS